MNTSRFLECLFLLARRARAPVPRELPFGLETAVLAHWRSAAQKRAVDMFLPALRRTAGFACAAALLCSLIQRDELRSISQSRDLQTRIADSALAAALNYE